MCIRDRGYIDQTQYDDAIADPVYERIQATNAQYEYLSLIHI